MPIKRMYRNDLFNLFLRNQLYNFMTKLIDTLFFFFNCRIVKHSRTQTMFTFSTL